MRLVHLEVERFQCIEKAELELGPGLNVLYGPNDLGKSSLAWAIRATPGLDAPRPPAAITTADLGRALVVDHVLAFEALSVLLLGAIVGAVVIARRRDPGEVARGFTAPSPERSTREREVSV